MKDFDYYLFTDGASSQNPGPGGFGAILISKKDDDFSIEELNGGEKKTTNNRMEIMAMIKGLEKTAVNSKVLIFSDSRYAIQGITSWIKKWIQNGWLTTLKKPVENKDLWQVLDELVANRDVSFKHIPGHSDISLNERADELAVAFYGNKKIDLFSGLKTDYLIKFNFSDFDKKFSKVSNKKKTGKAFSYVSVIDGVFEIHKKWDECKERVSGKPAKFKKVFSQEEEDDIRNSWTSNQS